MDRVDLRGQTVRIKDHVTHVQVPHFGGSDFVVEDYWDTMTGGSWMNANGNPACLVYAMRTGFSEHRVPIDNEVLYGKVGAFGHLVHVSEIELPEVAAIKRATEPTS